MASAVECLALAFNGLGFNGLGFKGLGFIRFRVLGSRGGC